MFPLIEHFRDIEDAIGDNSAFGVFDNGMFKSVCYNYVDVGLFPDLNSNERASVYREFRGISFDSKTGELISRPFHKFFNVNEREETLAESLDLKRDHVITEKYDGSMVRPVLLDGKWFLATKKGFSEAATKATRAIQSKHVEFFNYCWRERITPVFEFVGPNNRHVLRYEDTSLILLAIRDMYTGLYHSYDSIVNLAGQFDVEVAKSHKMNPKDSSSLVETISSLKDVEGVVLWFQDSISAYKIKTEEYVNKHGVIEESRNPRRSFVCYLDGTLDDILPVLSPEDRAVAENNVAEILKGLDRIESDVRARYEEVKNMDRKAYAFSDDKQWKKGLVFELFKGNDLRESMLRSISKKIHRDIRFQEIRDLWGF